MEKSNFAVPDLMPYCVRNIEAIFLKFPKAMKYQSYQMVITDWNYRHSLLRKKVI